MKPDELVGLIDAHYAERSKAENRCPIRLSAIGSCPRALAHQLAGTAREVLTPRTQRIFEMGSGRGEKLAKALEGYANIGVAAEKEVWLPLRGVHEPAAVLQRAMDLYGVSDLPLIMKRGVDERVEKDILFVRGRVDVLIAERDDCTLVEFKTKNAYGFAKLDEEGVDRGYAMQVCAYASALDAAGFNVGSCIVVYENKDTCELKAMPVDREAWADDFAECLSRLCGVLNDFAAVKSPNEAPAVYAQASVDLGGKLPWNCNYCDVGPQRGECVPPGRLVDKRKAGAEKPAWMVTS